MKRIAYLDGLRGVAALVVVLAHYTSVFSTAVVVELNQSALQRVLKAGAMYVSTFGATAVALFFLISGLALTCSFRASGASSMGQVQRRFIRLGLPLAVSILIAAGWSLMWPDAQFQAAHAMGGNTWLYDGVKAKVSLAGVAVQFFVTGIIFGLPTLSLFPHSVFSFFHIHPAGVLNLPTWTLQIEFYGSFLVLFMVKLEARLAPVWHRVVCLGLYGILIVHPLSLFVIGYVVGCLIRRPRWEGLLRAPSIKWLAVLSSVSGAAMGFFYVAPRCLIEAGNALSRILDFPMRLQDIQIYNHCGAILMFFGLALLPSLQRFFSLRVFQTLGKYSFSVYLVHFPILTVVSCEAFATNIGWGNLLDVLSAISVGLLLTVVVTFAFERLVDRPAVRWSRAIR